jgi:hypothetical protein
MPHGGRIIAMSSLGALRAMPGYRFVGASRAARVAGARSAGVGRGIRVNGQRRRRHRRPGISPIARNCSRRSPTARRPVRP